MKQHSFKIASDFQLLCVCAHSHNCSLATLLLLLLWRVFLLYLLSVGFANGVLRATHPKRKVEDATSITSASFTSLWINLY